MKQDLKEMRDIMLICLIAGGAIFNLHSRFKSDPQQAKHTIQNKEIIQTPPVKDDSLITDFNNAKQWTLPQSYQKTR